MGGIPSPIDGSILQTAQAQQVASKARDREKARNRTGREVEERQLKVDGVELTEAARQLPQNDSEQAQDEHRRRPPDDRERRLDVQA